MSLQYTMEMRLGETLADTEEDAKIVISTVSMVAHRKNHGKIEHEKLSLFFNNLFYLLT